MTENKATTATLRPEQQQHWPQPSETPSSSAQTSDDRLTPDSDSDWQHRHAGKRRYGGVGVYGGTSSGSASGRPRPAGDDDDYDDDYSDDDADDDDLKIDDDEGDEERGRGRRGNSGETAESFQLYTPEEEQAVVSKLDRRLVLFMALLYMLSFLDRSNIGNARIAGMDDDLQSTPRRDDWYEWALTAFYVTYIAFEWMAVLWRLIPAHIYVSIVVCSWGLIASLQAVAVNYPMLIFLRTLLGIGEAAFTGVPFYLSFFFKRDELAFRTAIFISAAPLATTFASSLAWVIIKIGQSSPIAPWRLLFLIEGFPSVLVAAVAWNLVPDSPQTAHYLTPREKKIARLRIQREEGAAAAPRRRGGGADSKRAATAVAGGLDAHDVFSAVRDPVAWMTAAIFFFTNMAYSSLPVFLPTILTAMGHSPLQAQALAAPPYLVSFVLVFAVAHVSDRARSRGVLVALHALASAVGYAALALSEGRVPAGSMLRYAAVFPAAGGFFGVVVLTVAWAVNNQASPSRRAGGFALLQAVGQCGPLLGTRLYPDAHAPFYTPGMSICAVAMIGVAVLALGLRFYLARLNRNMDAEESQGRETAVEDEEEQGLVGRSGESRTRYRFRYML